MNRSQKTVLGWGLGVFLATGAYYLFWQSFVLVFFNERVEPANFTTTLLLWLMDAVVVTGLLFMNKSGQDQ